MKRILIPALAILVAIGLPAMAQDDFEDLDALLDDIGDDVSATADGAAAPTEAATAEGVEGAEADLLEAAAEGGEEGALAEGIEEEAASEEAAAPVAADDAALDDLFTDITPEEEAPEEGAVGGEEVVEEAAPAAEEDSFADFAEEAPEEGAVAESFEEVPLEEAAPAADEIADDFADMGEEVAPAEELAGEEPAEELVEELVEEPAEELMEEPAEELVEEAGEAGEAVPAGIKEIARKAAALEEVRRQAAEADAGKASEAAFHALKAGKPAEAERLFTEAISKLVDRPQAAELRKQTLWGLAEAQQLQARAAIAEGDLVTARKLVESALQHDPTHRAAVALDKRLVRLEAEAVKVKPPARQPATLDRKKEVEELYAEGRQWFALRDYDRAQVLFERVLARDPYHKSAMRYIGRIERARHSVADVARDARRSGLIADVKETWNPPIPTFVEVPTEMPIRPGTKKETPSDRLQEKMKELIIPALEFRQANIADVVAFLVKASVEADPEGEGVNIILNLGPGGSNVPSEAAMAAPAAADDGWGSEDDGWGDETMGEGMGGGTSSGGANDITLNLRRISVNDAIKYITEVAGLKYRIEDRAVIITSLDAPIGSLVSRIYPVEPSIIESVIEREEAPDRSSSDFIGMGTTKVNKSDIQTFFEQAGVPFPAGAKCTYRNSRIIVRNTAENLEIFERILQEFNVVPSQIEIEARFIEVNQNDLDELGLQWILNDNWEIASKTDGSGGRIQADRNPNGLTQGLRFFGRSDNIPLVPMTPQAERANPDRNTLLGNILSISGVLTNPEVSVVIQALSQHGGTDLLSAPRVTARSEEPAVIQVVREIIYPTEFTVTQPSVNADGNVTMGPISEPSAFITRAEGVILNVTPTVGPDGYTIELVLAPEVCELVDWIQYGSKIEIPGAFGRQVWDYNMPAPVFSSRQVVTKISVWDGHTVVLGGLIREELTTVKDKVPILGDIPILGRLFRSEGQYSQKKNLLIFVTARLVDPAGRPVHSDISMPGQGMAADNSAVDAE